MVKITTKEEDNVKPRNTAVVFGKYSVICISRNNRKNILHIKIEKFRFLLIDTRRENSCCTAQ
jgi:hypothetical protein